VKLYPQPNGDIELADWPARKDERWTTWIWPVTNACNLGCSYCVGWNGPKTVPTLMDRYGVAGVVERFEQLRLSTKQDFYITLSGGEPLLEPTLAEVSAALTRKGFLLDVQTNFTSSNFQAWADAVDPKGVAQIIASYHAWKLDKDTQLQDQFLHNVVYAAKLGLALVVKRVIMPGEVQHAERIVECFKAALPKDTPIILSGLIRGIPKSLKRWVGTYPYSYTWQQKKMLNGLRKFRQACMRHHQEGGGFYQGMRCDAGRGLLHMTLEGNIYRCHTHSCSGEPLGNFGEATLTLNTAPEPCPYSFCGCSLHGGWFGEDPWNYVPGFRKEDCTFCRFGGPT